jgi:hypothetical protein
MAKTLGCRLGFHKWHKTVNDEGERVTACLRCGKPGSDYHPPASGLSVG